MMMRLDAGFRLLLSISLALLTLSCRAPAPVPPQPGWGSRPGEFSRDRAWQHLEALVRIGPRVTETEGASRARAYILDELSKLDIEVHTQTATQFLPPDQEQELNLTNLVGVVPGESEDVVILGAPYDSRFFEDFRFVGANDGASGAAVLLEMARVLAERPLPYTTWIAFFDAEALRETGDSERDRVMLLGSRAFAILLRQYRLVHRTHLMLALNRVCDADLQIARDSRSNRHARDVFFEAAKRLGRAEAFPLDQRFQSFIGSHLYFKEARLRVVGLSDTSFGGDEPPGLYANSEDDDLEHCSPESLETVGAVALEALEVFTKRIANVVRSTRATPAEPVEVPTEPLEPEQPSPEQGEAAPPEEAAGGEAGEPESEEPSPEESEEVSPQAAAESGAEAPGEASGQEEAGAEAAAP